jgi:hypothetical protein
MYSKNIILCADNNGYHCFMDKDHPLAHREGRVYLHRHLASMYTGRWLKKDEEVHHIDGIKKNNSEDNLLICSTSEHSAIHKGTILDKVCPVCKLLFTPSANKVIHCSTKCARLSDVKNKGLTKEVLEELIPTTSWVALGKMFGYSDNGIKKRAMSLGCNITKKRG